MMRFLKGSNASMVKKKTSDFNWEVRPLTSEHKNFVFTQTSCLEFFKRMLQTNLIEKFNNDKKYYLLNKTVKATKNAFSLSEQKTF